MTPFLSKSARRETVALTRRQVEQIVCDMGWEPEDADVFWDLACRETSEPGCLERECEAYWQRVFAFDGGQQ